MHKGSQTIFKKDKKEKYEIILSKIVDEIMVEFSENISGAIIKLMFKISKKPNEAVAVYTVCRTYPQLMEGTPL